MYCKVRHGTDTTVFVNVQSSDTLETLLKNYAAMLKEEPENLQLFRESDVACSEPISDLTVKVSSISNDFCFSLIGKLKV